MAEMEIDRNEMVTSADGMEIGRVTHVIVDGPNREVTDLVIEQNGAERLIPITEVERGGRGELMLRATPTETGGMPFTRDAYHAVDEDEIVSAPTGNRGGGTTIESASTDSVVINDARTAREMPAGTRQQTERSGENVTVPVVSENLTAGVRETEAGKFRLSKRVVEEQKTIDVPVEHEEVRVTETAVNRRPATQEELGMMNRDIEVPLRDQEVVTSKEARVTGEVDVRKEMVTDTERVSDTVRREEVHVEDSSNPHVHVENEGKRPR
ncbi:MAG: YsnF/AvaK domain-containing protein [Chloroflexota bacterium]|nr:YsnF/AvaK domain-containing protein [Chloroflexota bacterium]